MNFLRTRTQINGDKFMICYLMLFGSATVAGLLPLLVLIGPMKLIWLKPVHRMVWRIMSVIWLLASIAIGIVMALTSRMTPSGEMLHSFPIQFPADPMFGNDWALSGWIYTFNISIIAGFLFLPLTIASYLETKRRTRAAD